MTRKASSPCCLPPDYMFRHFLLPVIFCLFLLAPTRAFPGPPRTLSLPPNTSAILGHIYSGRRDLALAEIRALEQQAPDDPLGYLLEGEAEWWGIWCASAEFKYGMTMARHRDKTPADQHYLDVAAKAYSLAEASIRRSDSAQMRLYAGMADALAVRLYGLRGENRAAARAGVRARENLLKALSEDPTVFDAYTGLGLYNYYVDTLSTVARVLRFFLGIPGGNKEEGIRQLQRAIEEGELTPPVARFYLAMNLHTYDHRYEEALQVLGPLLDKYPENPVFQLARGDLYAKLGRKQLAEACYRAAARAASQIQEAECRVKIGQLARQSLAAVNPE
jgi:tetratricopeptide (TPR) repeat protein